MEAETKDGGLRLHNLELFDSSIKIGRLKRFIKINAKWKIPPTMFEFSHLFNVVTDFINSIHEIPFNPFWSDV